MTARANEFLVWRAGDSVRWECTAADIAAEVGLTPPGVRAILKRRGWKCEESDREPDPYAFLNLKSYNPRSNPTLRDLGVEA